MVTAGVTERNCRLAGAPNSYLGITGFKSRNEHCFIWARFWDLLFTHEKDGRVTQSDKQSLLGKLAIVAKNRLLTSSCLSAFRQSVCPSVLTLLLPARFRWGLILIKLSR